MSALVPKMLQNPKPIMETNDTAKQFRKILANVPQSMREPINRSLKIARDIHESSFHHQQKTAKMAGCSISVVPRRETPAIT